MKIVVLMGSPRKKDSYKVCEKIKESLMEQFGEALDFEYIMLNKLHIEECRGCEQCLVRGEQYCPIKDEADQLVEKMIVADGLILASPVYACQVTASFKKVVDRLSYLFHRPELIAKPTLTVVTSAGGGIKPTKDYLKLVTNGWACHLSGQLQVACTRYFVGRWRCKAEDIKYQQKINGQIEKITSTFVEDIKKQESGQKPKPSLYDVYIYNGLKSKTYTSQADYDFWQAKGWLNQGYYYETKLPLGSKIIEALMGKMLKIMAKKMGMS